VLVLWQSDALPTEPQEDNTDHELELPFDTVAYGIGNWHLYHGDTAKAQEYFRRILKGHVWITWGVWAPKGISSGRARRASKPTQASPERIHKPEMPVLQDHKRADRKGGGDQGVIFFDQILEIRPAPVGVLRSNQAVDHACSGVQLQGPEHLHAGGGVVEG
jgi:hypothetical protein